MKTGRPCT